MGQVLGGLPPTRKEGTSPPVVVGWGAPHPDPPNQEGWVLWDKSSVRKPPISIMSEIFQIMTCSFFDVSDLDPTQTN